jgi:hypothetical protein
MNSVIILAKEFMSVTQKVYHFENFSADTIAIIETY